MISTNRRAFLGGFSSTLLAAGLGGRSALAWTAAEENGLTFGALEGLVSILQETPPDELMGRLVHELRGGTELRTIVAATSLANARAFGGHDYTGYHCQMALIPAFEMSKRLPERIAPLPVLKVAYRSANQIQQTGHATSDSLTALPAAPTGDRTKLAARFQSAFRERDVAAAEQAFSGLVAIGPETAYSDLLGILLESLDVHRVVLAWRAYEVLPILGREHALSSLRQSVRFCIDAEKRRVDSGHSAPVLRSLLPELIERHGLTNAVGGTQRASDDELDALATVVFGSTKPEAAAAVAKALAAGLAPTDVGAALALAGNKLLLHDPGRSEHTTSEKPLGSVHGASVGVHAADSALAWRRIAEVVGGPTAMATLIAGAYHTAGQSSYVGSDPFDWSEPSDELCDASTTDALVRLTSAVEDGDQQLACAAAERYARSGGDPKSFFDALIEFAVIQDGALHAEKYFHTTSTECRAGRPAFRDRQMIALARVCASQQGWEAPGVADTRRQLEG